MNKLQYYIFGFLTAVYMLLVCLNLFGRKLLDKYYWDLLSDTYGKEYFFVHMFVAIILGLTIGAWICSLGNNKNERKEEENDE